MKDDPYIDQYNLILMIFDSDFSLKCVAFRRAQFPILYVAERYRAKSPIGILPLL
jgi:hypothetical protein